MNQKDETGGEREVPCEEHAGLRIKAEEILKERALNSWQERKTADEQALIHELQVHQIELEMQNEELKRARTEADILYSKYVDLYDFAPVGYFTIDHKGTILEVNLTGCKLLGHERQKTIGHRLQSYLLPESLPAFSSFCRNIIESGVKQTCEVELLRDRGRRFFAHVQGTKIPENGEDSAVIRMTISDITERKKIEERLSESENKYRNLFQSMLNGFAVHEIICNEEGIPYDYRYLDINPAFERITGLSREQVIGRTVLQVLPQTEKVWIERYGNVALTGEPDYFEEFAQELGKFFEVNVYRNAPKQFTTIFSDITERKNAEIALHLVNSKLNLLSSITRHDILNGITVLLGYIELASEEPLNPKMREYLKMLNETTDTIQHQIEFTKEYQEIGVNAADWQNVTNVVVKAGSAFKQEKVTLKTACNDVEIFADPLLLKVFYNLYDNAFRYAAPFTTITLSCYETEEGLSVVFSDDGAGIPADERKNLFKRGFGKHTGLGLFLSREILSITGITITENGEPGKGARFEMTVPKGAYRFTGEPISNFRKI